MKIGSWKKGNSRRPSFILHCLHVLVHNPNDFFHLRVLLVHLALSLDLSHVFRTCAKNKTATPGLHLSLSLSLLSLSLSLSLTWYWFSVWTQRPLWLWRRVATSQRFGGRIVRHDEKRDEDEEESKLRGDGDGVRWRWCVLLA